MGGGNYSKDWNTHKIHQPKAYSSRNIKFTSHVPESNTFSLNDLIQKYANSNIHQGNYSLDSIEEINKFFRLVDNILTSFQKIDQSQSQHLQSEFKKIKLQYRRSRISITNLFYNSLNSKNKPTHGIQAFSLNIDFDSPIRIKLSNFISWLDKTLQVYDLLPPEISKERSDER